MWDAAEGCAGSGDDCLTNAMELCHFRRGACCVRGVWIGAITCCSAAMATRSLLSINVNIALFKMSLLQDALGVLSTPALARLQTVDDSSGSASELGGATSSDRGPALQGVNSCSEKLKACKNCFCVFFVHVQHQMWGLVRF